MKDVYICSNPIVFDNLSILRNKDSSTSNFRRALDIISKALVYEASKELSLKEKDIFTPISKHTSFVIDDEIVIIPILRAGMGMLDAALSFYKDASVGYVGVKRNEKTLMPMPYYENLPVMSEKSVVFVLDPMLATGGSINYALDILKQKKVKKIVVLSVVGVNEGINLIKKHHPDVSIYLAALDERLNEVGYIVPGLGDCGDRLNKTE
ncbi:MAG: uracil phosphoribosyltransferase [Bacilli bacterium]|nr:uracil phosphoribosyltransferase [Bacilli bacterium]